MEKNRVIVTIFGKEYSLVSEVNPEYVTRAAEYVDSKMREVAQSYPNILESRIAVLAALNISDELFRSLEKQQENPDVEQAICKMTQKLSDIL